MRNNDLIINYGGVLLDVDEQSIGGFETYTLWDFGKEEAQGKGRSLDLSVPATKNNRKTLNFYDTIPGDGVRRGIEGAVICGGVAIDGTIFVSGFSGGRFNLMIAYGRTFGGFKDNYYALTDTMTFNYADTPALDGAIPDFGWYEYDNFYSPHSTIGENVNIFTYNALMFPSTNLGHIIDCLAASDGYTVSYPDPSLGRQYQAAAYGLVLPSLGLQEVYKQINISGCAKNGWTYNIIGGGTLDDLFLYMDYQYLRRGQIPQDVSCRVFVALRPINITLQPNSGVVMVKGTGYDLYNDWYGVQGVSARLNVGDYFTFVRSDEWHTAGNNNYWNRYDVPHAYEGNLSVSINVSFSGTEPHNGDTMRLDLALPYKPLEEWLDIYCNLIAGVWTADDSTHTITIKTYNELITAAYNDIDHHIALENERVIGVDSVKRYIDGFAQHNYTRCVDGKNYANQYTRDLRCQNDYLQKEKELAEIPITAGEQVGSSAPAVTRMSIDDVRRDDSGAVIYNGEIALFFENTATIEGARHISDTLSMGIGNDLQELVENGSSVSVKLLMPLFRFAKISDKTCASYHGRNFVVRDAKWSGGVAQLDLIGTAMQILQIPRYFPNAIQDYDENWYDAVVIGNQVWLVHNMRTTHYADGTPIPAGGSITSDTDPYYYDYSGSGIPLKDRGYLYNWPAVMKGAASSALNPSGVQGIAPTGWHVPSDAEWTQMTDYVGSVPEYILNNDSTYIAKALASQSYWNSSNNAYAVGNDLTANNKTLFGVVPAGYCLGASFDVANYYATFWSATHDDNNTSYAYGRYTNYDIEYVDNGADNKYYGYSVRCVCDLSPTDFAAWYYQQYGSYNHQL